MQSKAKETVNSLKGCWQRVINIYHRLHSFKNCWQRGLLILFCRPLIMHVPLCFTIVIHVIFCPVILFMNRINLVKCFNLESKCPLESYIYLLPEKTSQNQILINIGHLFLCVFFSGIFSARFLTFLNDGPMTRIHYRSLL